MDERKEGGSAGLFLEKGQEWRPGPFFYTIIDKNFFLIIFWSTFCLSCNGTKKQNDVIDVILSFPSPVQNAPKCPNIEILWQ